MKYGLGTADGFSLAKKYISGEISETELTDIIGKSPERLYEGLLNTMNYLNEHGNNGVVKELGMKATLDNFKHKQAIPSSV